MKIEEAITDLSIQLEVQRLQENSYSVDAIKLGIEALKRHQFIRTHYRHLALEPLPGETE